LTALDGLALAAYAFLTVALGRAALRLFPGAREGLLAGWAPGLLAGQLVLTSLLLLTGFLPVSMSPVGLFAGLAALGYGTARGYRTARGSAQHPGDLRRAVWTQLRPVLITAALLVALYPNVLFWVIQRPVVDWDARSIWFFHAKVLAVDRGLEPAFFTDPVYLHSSYPMLVPAQAAWLSLLRGGWSEMAGKSFLLLNFAAYLQLFLALLRAKGHPWWLGLGAAVLFFDTGVRSYGNGFGYAYVNGYADVHFIAPFLLALLAFSLPRSQNGPVLGALLLAFGANVKLESGLFAGLLAVVLAGGALGRWGWRRLRAGRSDGGDDTRPKSRGATGEESKSRWRWVGAAVALGGAPLLLWHLFRALHGIRTYLDPFQWLGTPRRAVSLIGARAGEIGAYFLAFFLDSGLPWLLAAGGLIVALRAGLGATGRLRGARPRGVEVAGAAAVCGLVLVIFVIYGLTPLELEVHLRTSADRLLFLPLALLYGLVLLALDPLLALGSGRGSLSSAAAGRSSPSPP